MLIDAISDKVRPVTIQNLLYYGIRAFEPYPNLIHAIFTRQGGASPPPYNSLNLSISTGDDPTTVAINYERACLAVGVAPEQTVTCHQIHSAKVYVVDRANQQRLMGRGDGLVTADPDIYLFMRFADCTPLLFFDPVREAVGTAHAGWRGTMQNVAGATVRAMVEALGCRPEHIMTVIGPAIGSCCYEVGPDVIDAARETFGDVTGLFEANAGRPGHAHFDMIAANRRQLVDAGVRTIISTALCTACRTDHFFSHRAEKGDTGRLGTLIGLRGVRA